MTGKKAVKKKTVGKARAKSGVNAKHGAEADPRFAPVAKAFAKVSGFSLMQSKSQASRGLMLNGKSFGLSQHGRFLLKLDEKRAAAHIAAGTGKPFDAAPGRPMKGWIEVTASNANWVALAKEAYQVARASQSVVTRARARSSKKTTAAPAPPSKKMSKGSR